MKSKPIILLFILLAVIVTMNVTSAVGDDRQVTIANIATGSNTDPAHPGAFLTDDNPDTYWTVTPNSGPGWAELSLNQESLIYGLQVSGELAPNSRLTVESWQNGYWVPFGGGSLQSIPSAGIIDLSNDRVVTVKLRLRLDSSGAGINKLAEIKALGSPADSVFQLIQPLEIKYSKDSHPTTPARFLSDRNPRTAWRIADDDEDDCAEIRNNHFFTHDAFEDKKIRQTRTDSSRQVELKLSGMYRLSSINLYITENAAGDVVVKTGDGRHWREAGRFNLTAKLGWQRIDLNTEPFETDRVLLQLEDEKSYNFFKRNNKSNRSNRTGGIGEVQIWGYGAYKGLQRQSLQPAPQLVTQALNYRFDIAEDDEGTNRLELAVTGEYNLPINIELNGLPIKLQPSLKINGNTVYQYTIPEDTLWDGNNFIRILPGEPAFTLLQIQITENNSDGEIPLPVGSLSDGLRLTPAIETGSEFNFNRESFIEAVEIYAPGNLAANVSAKTSTGLISLNQIQSDTGYLRFQAGINAQGLNITNHSGLPFAEIRVLGSMGPNTAPKIKVIWPQPEDHPWQEIPELNANDREYLLGRVDNPEATVTANGKPTNQSGNYFWIRLRDLGLDYGEINTITVNAIDPAGQAGSKQLEFFWGDSPDYQLDQKDIIYHTDKSTFTISGKVGNRQYEVLVAGKPVVIDRNRKFSAVVSLNEGFNLIPITFNYTYRGKEMHYTIHRRVVRESSGPILIIDTPLPGTITNSSSLTISGTVSGKDPSVKVNGVSATVVNGYFSSKPVFLTEGKNTVKVEATDSYGRKTSQEITINKDSKKPVISALTPVDGFISGTVDVTIGGKVTDAGQVYVYANGKLAVCQNGVFSVSLTLSEGENQIAIKAVDQAGNNAVASLKIKVDTQAPLPFTPSANPSGWTNNNKPAITFSTTDGFSGIDHYEIRVGDGAWIKPVTSPYRFGAPIPDGEQTIQVKAVDKARNYTIGEVKVYIDTVPPLVPDKFEVISGIGRAEIRWSDAQSEVKGYRITRSPAFQEGNYKEIYRDETGGVIANYFDPQVIPGEEYTYTLQAIDRAGNYGTKTANLTVKIGESSKEIGVQGGTVKFDNCEVIIPEGAIPEQGNIIIKETTADLPVNEFAVKTGPVYSFTFANQSGEEVPIEFEEKVNLKISYAQMNIPVGFEPANLGVYWYNQEGEYWEKLEHVQNDLEQKTLTVPISHFSEYQVMASNYESPSLDSYYDMGLSPYQSYFQDNIEYVSPESGSLVISAIDLQLPGRSGFDLIIKRIYDSKASSSEAPFDTFGNCWFLNIPWLELNDKGQFVRLPDGQTIYIQWKNKTFEYHEGTHFTLKRSSDKYTLTLNNGTVYKFNKDGKPISQTDPSGKNIIQYEYNGREITQIIDSIGRIVQFTYEKKRIIKVQVDNRVVKYNYENDIFTVEDPLGRKTIYNYDKKYTSRIQQITYPTGENSTYIFVDNKVSQHSLMGKVTSYEYEMNKKIENGAPLNTYLYSCRITEGSKTILKTFRQLKKKKHYSWEVNPDYYYYRGNLQVSEEIFDNGVEKLKIDYGYDLPIRAINNEVYYRSKTYQITSSYDNWGNIKERYDGSRDLKETWTYHDHSRIKNLVATQVVENNNPLTGGVSKITTSYTYDDNLGKPTEIDVKGDGLETLITSYEYDEYGNLKTKIEPNGLKTMITYDVTKNAFPVSKTVSGLKNVDKKDVPGIITYYRYNPDTGMKEQETDPRGFITKYQYDKLNRVTKVTLPDDDSDPNNNPYREYIFHDDLNTCEFYNEKRQKTTFRFDGLGRLTNIIKDTSEKDKPHTIYQYDTLGRIDTVTDPLGNKTTYSYDGLNRVIKVEFPNSNNPAVIATAKKLVVTLEYDDANNTVTIVEHEGKEDGPELGRTIEKSDWANRLVAATQSCLYDGIATQYNWEFKYDSLGNKLQQIDPLYSQNNQTFDALGRLTNILLPNALLVKNDDTEPESIRPDLKYEYDKMGNRIAETDARGNRVEYEYDLLGRVIKTSVSSTNHLKNEKVTAEVKNYYDACGNKVRVIDAKGKSWDYTYSARGWLLSEKDPLGNVTRYHYDVLGNKISVTDPRNKTGYEIVNGEVVLNEATNDWSYTTWYVYDDLNRLRRTVLPDATPPSTNDLTNGNYDNPYTEITYDMNGNKLSERDPNGVLTEYTYTPRNQVEQVRVNQQLKAQYVYDAKGNPIRVESVSKDDGVLNYIINNKYDSLGRLRKVSKPSTKEEYEYDAVGNRTSVKDGNDNGTYYQYNSLGWLTDILDPLNNHTKYQYDQNGNQVKIIAANDRPDNRVVVSNYYDELNRVYRTVDTLGQATMVSYDPNGNRSQMVDRRGSTWKYQYEDNNLLKRLDVKNGSNSYFVKYTYDAAGNRTQVEDNRNTNNYNYNELSQLTQMERNFDDKKYTTGYQYDRNRLTGIMYPEAKELLRYQYDNENRINEVTGFTAPQGIAYEADGALRGITLTNGITTGYTYDSNRRLQSLQVSNNILQLSNIIYDNNNNISKITDNGKVKTYEYDRNNQLTKTVIPGRFLETKPTPGAYGLKIGDYLGASWMDFMPVLNAMVGLDYNSSSIGIDFGTVASGIKKIQLIPDQAYQTHRIIERTLNLYTSADNLTYQVVPRSDYEFVKDTKGVITITLKKRLAARYLKVHVKFDEHQADFKAKDKATFLNDLAKMLRVYQEATSRTEEFRYDKAGNRTLQKITLVQTDSFDSTYYPNSDRLKTDGKYFYNYDNNGNLIEKGNKATFNGSDKKYIYTTSGEGVEYWHYDYDLLNRLIEVKKNGTIIAEYGYDPEGLRVIKKIYKGGVQTDKIHYVFEGTEPIFEKRISDSRIRSYVYAFGKHLARVDGVIGDATAKKFFYHTDHVGSVRAVTDDVGKVVWKSDYLAFGKQFGKDKLDSSFEEDEFAFTGKGLDGDTGLYYYNARWYDAETGRFMSEDPMADPNNPNLYSYCANNPVNIIDPSGFYGYDAQTGEISFADGTCMDTKGNITNTPPGGSNAGYAPRGSNGGCNIPQAPDLSGPDARKRYDDYWENLPDDFYRDPYFLQAVLQVMWMGVDTWGKEAMPSKGWGTYDKKTGVGNHTDTASMNMVKAVQAAVGIANPDGEYGNVTRDLVSLLNLGGKGGRVGQAILNKMMALNQQIMDNFHDGLVGLKLRNVKKDVIPVMDQFVARRFMLLVMNTRNFNYTITSIFRITAHQNELWELKQQGKMPYIVARPGTSPHEAGLAFDVVGLGENFEAFKSIANQCGFNWRGPDDPVHFGVPDNRAGYASRAEAIATNQAVYNQYFQN